MLFRITICESFVHRRKLLLGESDELFGVGAPGRQQGGDDAPAFGGHHITMGPRHFANQAMRPQQRQLPPHARHLPPARRRVRGRAVEGFADVAIAGAIDEVFAPVDRRQQRRVGLGQRIEGAIAPAALPHAPADGGGFLAQ